MISRAHVLSIGAKKMAYREEAVEQNNGLARWAVEYPKRGKDERKLPCEVQGIEARLQPFEFLENLKLTNELCRDLELGTIVEVPGI